MKNSYQSELDSYVAFQACMGATAPAPLLDIPELACFPQPMVSDDGCFTVPLVDITLVCSGEFWCVGVGGTNTCTGPADIQLCLPGTGGVPIS